MMASTWARMSIVAVVAVVVIAVGALAPLSVPVNAAATESHHIHLKKGPGKVDNVSWDVPLPTGSKDVAEWDVFLSPAAIVNQPPEGTGAITGFVLRSEPMKGGWKVSCQYFSSHGVANQGTVEVNCVLVPKGRTSTIN